MNSPLEVSPRDYHTRLTLDRSNIFGIDSWLSKSALYQLSKMSLYRWRFAPPEFTGSAAVDWGTVVDCLVTTPDELEEVVRVHEFDDFRTKEAKEVKVQAKEDGKVLFHASQLEQARIAADRIMDCRDAAEIIDASKMQVVLLRPLMGVNFKGLVDFAPVGKPYLADLKTTGDLSPQAISKRIADLGYHVQGAIYLKLWNICFPDDQRKRFRLVWQSQQPPYEVAVTELTAQDLAAGSEYAAFLLNKLITAAKANKWPNIFGDKVAMVARPQYAMFQEEEQMEGFVSAPNPNKEGSI